MLVAIELVGLGVVGYEQIGPPIVVVVEQRDSQRLGTTVEDSACRGDVFKRAVPFFVKEPAGGAAIGFRSAVRLVLSVKAAEQIVFRPPLHRLPDKKTNPPPSALIKPQCYCP